MKQLFASILVALSFTSTASFAQDAMEAAPTKVDASSVSAPSTPSVVEPATKPVELSKPEAAIDNAINAPKKEEAAKAGTAPAVEKKPAVTSSKAKKSTAKKSSKKAKKSKHHKKSKHKSSKKHKK
jgi:hypothetical protein